MDRMFPAVLFLSLVFLLDIGRARGRLPKPVISLDPISGFALEGGIIIIKCGVDIDGPKCFNIFRGEYMIFEAKTDSNTSAVFTKPNVTSEDRGKYRCVYLLVLSGERSSSSNVIRVTVMAGIKAPLTILHSAAVDIITGASLSMSCTTAGNGQCFYYQNYDDAVSNFQIAEERSNATVSITNLSFCDEGNYTCQCLIEVNGAMVYSARSNLMQITVSDYNLILAFSFVCTALIVLILIAALLGAILPKWKIALAQSPSPDENELQDISD
ncbi:uncharacterized protein LOC144493892 [Mustelus asterias]